MSSLQLKHANFGETVCGIKHKVGEAVGGMLALNMTCFLSSGFIRLDDVAMGISGAFSIIDRIDDMLMMAREGCGEGRGCFWVSTLAVVGPESSLVIVGLSDIV